MSGKKITEFLKPKERNSISTSATPERSFSMARRLKTWLRSIMTQKRFNSLVILNCHRGMVDKLFLIDIANDFVEGRLTRRNDFGVFEKSSLHL